MDAPDTVVDALHLLRGEGYTTEFQLADGHLRCDDGPSCQVTDAVALNALHPPLDDCVLERVRAWRFPPPSGGVVSVTYPFTLVRSP